MSMIGTRCESFVDLNPDIGANLTDLMYAGVYNDHQCHEPDLDEVIQRAKSARVEKIIVTAGNLEDVKKALELVKVRDGLYTTVGVHPTRCSEFEEGPDAYLASLLELAEEGKDKIVAVGEFGLDYDRTQFCPIDLQKKYFAFQFALAEKTGLPLFLHLRGPAKEFTQILRENRDKFNEGVVHSFDGTLEDMKELIELGLYIGLNGCSLKTAENLEVIKEIPRDRLMIETDAPWCQIRPSHAGSKFMKTKFTYKDKKKWDKGFGVKGRNEPNHLIQVAEVIANVRGEPLEEFLNTVYENTTRVFFPTK